MYFSEKRDGHLLQWHVYTYTQSSFAKCSGTWMAQPEGATQNADKHGKLKTRLQNIASQKNPCTSSVQMQDDRGRMMMQDKQIYLETLSNATQSELLYWTRGKCLHRNTSEARSPSKPFESRPLSTWPHHTLTILDEARIGAEELERPTCRMSTSLGLCDAC